MIKKCNLVPFILIMLFFNSAHAQLEIPLYPGEIPNAKEVPNPERIESRGENNRAIYNTAVPTLSIFTPEIPNGKAVIICPGGGYSKTAFDKEGVLVAGALIKEGITAFVLKYRIPQDLTNIDKSIAPLQDAQQAIRYVRINAEKYKINPSQIGIMGFSAGGHLAACAATKLERNEESTDKDTVSIMPNFTILIYPVISFNDELTHMGSRNNLIGTNPSPGLIEEWSADKQVTSKTPPSFLVHAADDKAVPVGNSLSYYAACIEHNVPVEMHLYPNGGHGFGMYNKTTKDDWMERLNNWLEGLFELPE